MTLVNICGSTPKASPSGVDPKATPVAGGAYELTLHDLQSFRIATEGGVIISIKVAVDRRDGATELRRQRFNLFAQYGQTNRTAMSQGRVEFEFRV